MPYWSDWIQEPDYISPSETFLGGRGDLISSSYPGLLYEQDGDFDAPEDPNLHVTDMIGVLNSLDYTDPMDLSATNGFWNTTPQNSFRRIDFSGSPGGLDPGFNLQGSYKSFTYFVGPSVIFNPSITGLGVQYQDPSWPYSRPVSASVEIEVTSPAAALRSPVHEMSAALEIWAYPAASPDEIDATRKSPVMYDDLDPTTGNYAETFVHTYNGFNATDRGISFYPYLGPPSSPLVGWEYSSGIQNPDTLAVSVYIDVDMAATEFTMRPPVYRVLLPDPVEPPSAGWVLGHQMSGSGWSVT